MAKLDLAGGRLYQVTASKPNHEVGASRLLSFAKPAPAAAPAAPAASVWVLEDMEVRQLVQNFHRRHHY